MNNVNEEFQIIAGDTLKLNHQDTEIKLMERLNKTSEPNRSRETGHKPSTIRPQDE